MTNQRRQLAGIHSPLVPWLPPPPPLTLKPTTSASRTFSLRNPDPGIQPWLLFPPTRHMGQSSRPHTPTPAVHDIMRRPVPQRPSKLRLISSPQSVPTYAFSTVVASCIPCPRSATNLAPSGRTPRQPCSLQLYPTMTGRVLRFSRGYTPSLCVRASRTHLYLWVRTMIEGCVPVRTLKWLYNSKKNPCPWRENLTNPCTWRENLTNPWPKRDNTNKPQPERMHMEKECRLTMTQESCHALGVSIKRDGKDS